MSWKKYFTPVKTTGQMSPISGGNGNTGANPSRTNYSSFLPDVYSGHPNRLERYSQYDTMALDPEIDSALDILAEFCTQMNEENSTPFHIFFRDQATPTEIKIIKKYLQQWSKLNKFGTRMFRIVRNTFKYGDSFFIRDPETLALFYIDPAKVDKIIVNESEGKEPEQYVIRDLNVNFQNLTVTQINPSNQNTTPGGTAYITGGAQQRGMVGAYPQSVGSRFGVNQNQVAVEAKHVVHLSMSEGLDNNFPFGNSLLESIFKVYKQKELLEDAIIIYRIQRAPERRIFYIDVGNMPSHLAMSFVERVKQEVNQRRIPSISGGGASVIDSSYNPLAVGDDYFFPQTCLSLDQEIKLLDDRSLSLRDIINEYESGKDNYTYTVNQKTLEIEPGKIVWAGVTRKNTQMVEVLLDNGEKIKTTPDHRYIMRDGSEVEAQNLNAGDSLMPLYLHNATTGKNQGADKYLRFTCPATGKKKWVHTMVCAKSKPGRETEIHHIDLNSRNNHPANLVEMETAAHRQLHKELGTYHLSTAWNDPQKRARIITGMHDYHANATDSDKEMFKNRGLKNGAPTWQRPESAAKVRTALIKSQKENAVNKTIKYSDGMCARLVQLYDSGFNSISKLKIVLRDDQLFQQEFKLANKNLLRDKNLPDKILPTDTTLVKMAQYMGYSGWDNFKKTYQKNHKIVSVTFMAEFEDTGDITIESKSDSHNFALTAGVFIHNSEGRGSKVDTLPGGCFAMDTSVSLLDGRELTIREIEEEMKQGKTLWTYSCDPVTGKVVPGLITWAGVTHKSAKVMRITLDNGESVVCTPEHQFVTRHNGFAAAETLKVGDSLMPLYRRKEKLYEGYNNDYEQFFDNQSNEWKFTHRMVADYLRGSVVKEWVHDPELNTGNFSTRHHKNFNRFDNSPENLCFMNHQDHIKYHGDNITNFRETLKANNPELYTEMYKRQAESLSKNWAELSDEEYQYRCKLSAEVWQNHTPEEYEQRCDRISQGITEYVDNLTAEEREIRAQNSRDAFKLGNVEFNRKMNSDPAFYEDVVTKRMKYWTDDNRKQRGQAMSEIQAKQWADPTYAQKARDELAQRQKPVFSENMLRFVIDKVHGKTSHQVNAMDIVEAMNANQDLLKELHDLNAHKSIPNWSGKFTPSILKLSMIKYFGYNNWADFRRKESVHNHRITHIEYLEEPIEVGTLTIDGEELFHGYHTFALSIGIEVRNSNLGEISDLLFFTQKLMRALRIPSSYLPTGIDDSQNTFNDGRVGTAYIQELRFNKYCERLQSLIDEKFDNEFKLYLDKKGINIDFNLFDLRFNPPQNFAAYRQAEMDTARVTVYGSVSQIPHLSKRFALKRFLGLTPEEIAENEQLWREENLDDTSGLSAQAELRSAGITTAGLSGDLGAFDQATEASEDMGQMETGAPNMGISSAQPASGATTAPGTQ